jgi:hypothetical protein
MYETIKKYLIFHAIFFFKVILNLMFHVIFQLLIKHSKTNNNVLQQPYFDLLIYIMYMYPSHPVLSARYFVEVQFTL